MLTDLSRFASAIPPPARLRADALGLPTPPQGGSNGGHREFPSGIDHHACGLVPPHRISPRLVGNHEGCPYKCNGVDNHEGCPRKCCGVEGAFPRRSLQHLRPKTPKTSAGHNRLLTPQRQFAEKQPPRRLSGALLFRPFSWAGNERQPAASPPPPFSPFPLRKGGRGDRSLYRNTSTGFSRTERTN